MSEHYKSFVWRVWEKTGCLITADGSDDAKIQPEGLPAYKVQPPLPIDAANAAPTSNVTKPAEQDQEGEAQEAQEDEELDPQTVTEREDKESDRTTDAPLVGRQLRGPAVRERVVLWEKSSTLIEAWTSTVWKSTLAVIAIYVMHKARY